MGSDYERDFVTIFSDPDGWFAQRAAASGSATTNALPDVTIGHDGTGFAGELKTVASDTKYLYIDEREIEQLENYSRAFGFTAVAIGRWKQERAFYLWRPEDMDRTRGGNYRGSRGDENWAIKIAEPDGGATGVHPSDLSSFELAHALRSNVCEQRTTPFENSEGAYQTGN